MRTSLERLKRVTMVLAVIAVAASVYLLLPQIKARLQPAASTAVEGQVVTVERGNLTIDITGIGNLALTTTADLAFQMGGTVANPLYVQEVLVEVGDNVKQGQVLARADVSGWQSQVASLETTLTQKQTNLDSARLALNTALAQTEVSKLEIELKQEALRRAQNAYWDEAIKQAYGKGLETDFTAAAANLRAAEAALAKLTMTGPQELERKRGDVQSAETSVKDAANDLAQAQATSPELKAPFDGFVTKVSVKGGDEIKKGIVAVSIADPTKFQADILVSEMDILQVQMGARATVEPSAISTVKFPAKVIYISPTATVSQGVVNYKVTVQVESLVPVQTSQPARTPSTGSEQAQKPPAAQGTQPSGQATQAQPAAAQAVQLRQGLSVNVSLVLQETVDVLFVPNRAITRRGRDTFVNVVTDSGTEERWVLTGTSTIQSTEVIAGVNEGEKVLIPKTTTTTTQNQPQMPNFRMPGIGR
ncbi:MAG: HlyD family efflux transporter periplasmic adaptor subunit [Chloroflexota bacterium]